MEFREIGEYGFFQFCVSVQEAFKDGYELDLENNDNCPQQIGTYFHALMKKREVVAKSVMELTATLNAQNVIEGIDKIKEKIAELDKPEEDIAALIEKNLAVNASKPTARVRGAKK